MSSNKGKPTPSLDTGARAGNTRNRLRRINHNLLRHIVRRNCAAQIRRPDGVNHTCLEHVKVGSVNLLYGKRAVCVDGLAVGRDAHGKRMVVALGAESDVGDLDGAVLGHGQAGKEADGEE